MHCKNAFVTLFEVQDSSHVLVYRVRVIGDKKEKNTEKDSYIVLVRKRTVVKSCTHVGAATL